MPYFLSPSSAFLSSSPSPLQSQSLRFLYYSGPNKSTVYCNNPNIKKLHFNTSEPQQGMLFISLSAQALPNSYSSKPIFPSQKYLRLGQQICCRLPLCSCKENGLFQPREATRVVDLLYGHGRIITGKAVENLDFNGNERIPTNDRGKLFNSVVKDGSLHLKQERKSAKNCKEHGPFPTKEATRVVDLFFGHGRIIADKEVENLDFNAHGRVPTDDQGRFCNPVMKDGRLHMKGERKSNICKENGGMSLQNCVKVVGDHRLLSESLNFEENGRASLRNPAEFVDSNKENGRFLTQGQAKNLNFNEDGAITTKDNCQGTVESVKRNNNELTTEEEEAKLLDSVVGSGRSYITTIVDKTGNISVKDVGEATELVEQIGRLHTQEQVECSDSFEGNGRSIVLDIVNRIRRLPIGEKIEVFDFLGSCREHLMLFDFNNLLIALVKADRPESAASLFSDISSYGLYPDSRTFSIMVRCFCKKNEPDEAGRILNNMIKDGFHPNVVTFTILINCFCKRGRLQKAFEIFEMMRQIGCEPTVQTYNCLINGLCFVGRIEEAYDLLVKIRRSSKKPDIYTFTAVMDGLCKVGRSDEGMELLKEAEKMGLKPTVVTFNTLFNGYCREGRPLDGIGILREMKERDCWPDFISYSTLLHGLLKWNETYAALEIYKEMKRTGFEANEQLLNTLVRRICRKSLTDKKLLKDAKVLFGRLKEVGSGPAAFTYCLMIQALVVSRWTDEALAFLHEMVRIGYPPRPMTYNSVIRVLCREGRVDDAWLVLLLSISSGRTSPSRISCNLLLDEFNCQGRLLDACKVYALAMKRGVFPHQKPIALSLNEKEVREDVLEH